jgi:hypothetical protein
MTRSADGHRLVYLPHTKRGITLCYAATWSGSRYVWTPMPAQLPYRPWVAATGALYLGRDVYDPAGRSTGYLEETRTSNPMWVPSAGGPLLLVSEFVKGGSRNGRVAFGPGQPPLSPVAVTRKSPPQSAHLCEPLGVIATFGSDSDTVVLHKFDLAKLLAGHTGEDPLAALVSPPAKPGGEVHLHLDRVGEGR